MHVGQGILIDLPVMSKTKMHSSSWQSRHYYTVIGIVSFLHRKADPTSEAVV